MRHERGPFPMVTRHITAKWMNAVLNDDAVRPWVADVAEGPLDITPQVANQDNVLLMGEHGGCFFIKTALGSYEVHTACLKSGRGKWIFAFARHAVSFMFTQTDAVEIMTRIPATHPAARMLAVKTGLRYEFTRDDHCLFMGENVPVDIYSFRIQDWMPNADGMQEIGHDFHEKLNAAVAASGQIGEPHADDPNHNQYIGACVLMLRAGQIHKGVACYNRWAFASRHQPVILLSMSPPTLKFDAGTIVFLGDDIKVIAP